MRYAFCEELNQMAAENKNIILLTGDLGYTVFEDFASNFPGQFFNVGVAESNMMGVAAGLALSGKIVFAYSIATFATYRPYEFIRNDICVPNLPVVIVGSGAGFSYGDAGPTHHALEDISLMRSLPNMTVLCPADPIEAKWATRRAAEKGSPLYLRLGKKGEPPLYEKSPNLKLGKVSWLAKGPHFTVFATGNIVSNALKAVQILGKGGLVGSIASVHTVKPIDSGAIEEALGETGRIISIEEHRKMGGLGSAISEVISQSEKKGRHLIIGVEDKFASELGNQNYLRQENHLSAESIAKRIKMFVR